MKKKVSFVSTVVIAVFTTAVLASGIISFDSAPLSTPPETKFIPTPAMEAVESNLSPKENLRSADSFASVANCADSAKYHNVTAYTAFMGENSFTSSQLEIINRILDKGTTIQSLAQVYDFWLTTSEPFSIIEDICALEERYFSEFWYENAFNALTNDKCGVLDSKDIDEYKEKDITAEQILAANTLCRKGKYTITEILDMAVNGRDIEDIACEVYEIDSLPEADSLNEKINLVIEAKKLNISDKSVA